MTDEARDLPREVFLSHAAPDRKLADALASTLRAHGVPVWYSQTNVLGAHQWHDEIGLALRRCDWFVLLLSSHGVRSAWVKREYLFALNSGRFNSRITPVIVGDCDPLELSWTLDAIQRLDFRTSYIDGCRELLRAWGIGLETARLHEPE